MLMANLQATLRGQLLFCDCAKDCIKRANDLLYKSTDTSKFVTLFFGILDTEKNTLTYCNAGHNEPLFTANAKISKLDKGGLLLSCFEDSEYDEEEIIFEKGSTLVIFSDGITEAMNEADEEYTDERLEKLLLNNINGTSQGIIKNVIDDIKFHVGNYPQSDDITIMIIKRNE